GLGDGRALSNFSSRVLRIYSGDSCRSIPYLWCTAKKSVCCFCGLHRFKWNFKVNWLEVRVDGPNRLQGTRVQISDMLSRQISTWEPQEMQKVSWQPAANNFFGRVQRDE